MLEHQHSHKNRYCWRKMLLLLLQLHVSILIVKLVSGSNNYCNEAVIHRTAYAKLALYHMPVSTFYQSIYVVYFLESKANTNTDRNTTHRHAPCTHTHTRITKIIIRLKYCDDDVGLPNYLIWICEVHYKFSNLFPVRQQSCTHVRAF